MSIIIGLTGKPNTGKSTFFKAATMVDVEIGNYPFTTINPNHGIAYIQTFCICNEKKTKCKFCDENIRNLPINLIDVAGLVPDAHLGKGLGNKFLDDLRQADSIIHIIDGSGSTDIEGNCVQVGSHNPLEDIQFLNNELELWIYDILSKNWLKIIKKIKNESIKLENILSNQLAGTGVRIEHINIAIEKLNLKDVDITKWDDKILHTFCNYIKKVSRNITIVANKIDITLLKNINLLKSQPYNIYLISAEAELTLRIALKNKFISYIPGNNNFSIINNILDKNQINCLNKISSFLNKYNSTGVQNCLNDIIFNVLKMIVIYPVEDENKWTNKNGILLPTAFLMKSGSTCYDLAKKIHTDISSSFLYAIDSRTKKRISEKYILKNNDVIKIVYSSRSIS